MPRAQEVTCACRSRSASSASSTSFVNVRRGGCESVGSISRALRGGGGSRAPLARVSGGRVEGIGRHGRVGPRESGLAFDFNMAPSSGVSFDLFAVPPLCAVSACGGLTTAEVAGWRADADPGLGAVPAADFSGLGVNAGAAADPGVGAVAATGVAGVSAPAEPSVDDVAAAGVAGGPTDSEPRAGAVEAAGVA